MQVLIPLAGEGSRFRERGYTFPKPLIDVGNGKSMIELVVDNLKPITQNSQFIFLVRKEHLKKYNLEQALHNIVPDPIIITVDKLTEGAACTALLARNHIDTFKDLLIANADQYIDYNAENFNVLRQNTDATGIIFSFYSSHPKWSFSKLDKTKSQILEVAEKVPISNVATAGIYYWRYGYEFVQAADNMISQNFRVNNEFYIAPVYNFRYDKSYTSILPFFVNKMFGLGTPEDLESFRSQ